MVAELFQILKLENVIVEPFVVGAALEGQQEVVFLYKLQLLAGYLGVFLIGGADEMLWITVNRFIVQRVRSTQEIFPFLVTKTIGSIRLGIIPRTQMGSGPPAKTQPKPFYGIKTVEGTRRTYFERPGLFIARQQQCAPVHQPPVR